MYVNVDVEKPFYRFMVLFFSCLLTFGTFYCYDMPSVVQDDFQKDFNCNETANASCCSDCLGMSPSQYNLLYAVYSWTSAVVVIGTGFFIDKCGNQIGAIIFSSLCVIGSCIFALGAFYRGSPSFLPLMLLGRLLFGAGNSSVMLVQNRIVSFWFNGKELALAFGIILAVSRLGSVLNFFLTGHLRVAVGLQNMLWIGSGLCGLGLISSVIVGALDIYGFRRMGVLDKINSDSKNVRMSDVKQFNASYWLLLLTLTFFYSAVLPFVADASKFFKDKYDYDEHSAAYIAGSIYDVALVLSPFLGGFIDVFGKRGILTTVCSVATIPVFGLLAFSNVDPLVSTLLLGVTYSVGAASLFPSIPLVVDQATVGTAMGIASCLQTIGMGFSNLIVGEILGAKEDLPHEVALSHWKHVMIYLLGNIVACVVSSIALNIIDTRKNGVLNRSRKQTRLEKRTDRVIDDGTAPRPLEEKHER